MIFNPVSHHVDAISKKLGTREEIEREFQKLIRNDAYAYAVVRHARNGWDRRTIAMAVAITMAAAKQDANELILNIVNNQPFPVTPAGETAPR